ncbi:ATP-binding protein [Anaeromicrobium sediminis]|uniref:histidine kinase n=1 Tax=Anaeromicrobium sediminis TaxID=1478221 RepID=A0A267MMS4_9FIRM|nr:ATP-binding protein [Anaeromicrobium sediminis]PAB60712.1 hypothetical protein CCE28_04010 [Anaeromicrobium sediminis]
MNRKVVETIGAICVLVVFTGQIYITPFFEWTLRFSFSVTTLSLLFIYFKEISIITTSIMVSMSVLIFRVSVQLITNPNIPLYESIVGYYRGALFYIFFGVLFYVFKIREKIDKIGLNFIFLFICEVLANFIEIFLSKGNINYSFDEMLKIIILVGTIRTCITLALYYGICNYLKRRKIKEEENKYRQLVSFIANLKSELFLLKKSSRDIENAMDKCFHMYKRLEIEDLKEDALSISKDIHEIKKDYIRVILGMEKNLDGESIISVMSFEEIKNIIKGNTQKIIELSHKKIRLEINVEDDFHTNEFYPIISILNNLIVNSIESINESGYICIEEKIHGDYIVFTIEDNGEGIHKDEIKLIFNPGYSTKFNKDTGAISTGIGLTHVHNIVGDYFKGRIKVESKEGVGTVFKIEIPKMYMIN